MGRKGHLRNTGVRNREPGVRKQRPERNEGIEKALQENDNIGIIAIGNAPTALIRAIEILNNPELATPSRNRLLSVSPWAS